MIDYHIHTPLCNHANGSMEEYVLSAIGKGLTEICFLDHFIASGPGTRHSMSAGEIPLYMQAIACLRHRYRDRITIRAGLEVDFLPEEKTLIEDILGRYDFDAVGGSFHFVRGINVASRKLQIPEAPAERDALMETYFEGLIRMLDWPYFDFFCHVDVVKRSGIEVPLHLEPLVDEFLRRLSEKGLALEFNASGWNHPCGEGYPAEHLVRRCFDLQIPFTLGSDAHSPSNVGAHFDKALAVLAGAGYTELSAFEGRKGKRLPLKNETCRFLS